MASVTWLGERQYPRIADRGWAKSDALPGSERLQPASWKTKHAGSLFGGLLPTKAPATPRHRQRQVRHYRKHRCHRARRHPRLRPAAGLRDRTAFYSRDKLIYDAERDQCGVPRPSRCRGTAPSTPKRWSSTASRPSLTTPARSRQHAPTRNAAGIIQRSVYAAYLEKVHGYHATEAYKSAMRKSRDDRLRKSASDSMSWCRERAVCAHIQVSGESDHVRQFAPRSSEQGLMPLSRQRQERG